MNNRAGDFFSIASYIIKFFIPSIKGCFLASATPSQGTLVTTVIGLSSAGVNMKD